MHPTCLALPRQPQHAVNAGELHVFDWLLSLGLRTLDSLLPRATLTPGTGNISKRLLSCATEQLHSAALRVAGAVLSSAHIMDGLQTVHQDQGQRSKLLQDGINHGGNTRKVYASGPAASAIFFTSGH